jgi:hypothetical protein
MGIGTGLVTWLDNKPVAMLEIWGNRTSRAYGAGDGNRTRVISLEG